MPKTKNIFMQSIGFLIALLIFLTSTSVSSILQIPIQFPSDNESSVNAAAKIKTLKAANSIKGGIRGIDVSKWNGTIDWKKVAGDDVYFAFIRATYGTDNDAKFVTNAKDAHKNGIKVGAYHFATFKNSAGVKKEAKAFIKQLKKVNITYPVVLDLEGQSHKKIKKATLTKLATEFMDLVKAEGYTVMLYSYDNFITAHLDKSKLKNYNLWVANFIQEPKNHSQKIWQYASTGTIKGIKGNVDLNISYKDLSTKGKIKLKTKKSTAEETAPKTTKEKETEKYNDIVEIIDEDIAASIRKYLTSNYGASFPDGNAGYSLVASEINRAIQIEVNKQWELDLPEGGEMSNTLCEIISQVNFTSSTKGNITYMLQAKLYYLGYYNHPISARFDSNTVAAVKAFQSDLGLNANGKLAGDTLYALLFS